MRRREPGNGEPKYDAAQSANLLIRMALDGLTLEEAEAELAKAEANSAYLKPPRPARIHRPTNPNLPNDFTDFI